MNKEEAIKACKNGAIAAVISGLITAGFVLFAVLNDADGKLSLWNDPLNIFDVIFVFVCAYGLIKKSRAAAVFLLIYFTLSKIIIWLEIGKPTGIFLSLIFFYYYIKAVQGTFTYHKIEKSENPDYKSPSKKILYIGIPVGLVFTALVIVGILTMTDIMPSTKVVDGSKVYNSERELLVSENIILNDEKIEYFYSEGLSSILESGNILTDRRVIAYTSENSGELEIYELFFNDITSVELVEKGGFWNPSIYKVSSPRKDAWLKLYLSTEGKGDLRFVKALRSKVNL